MKILLDENFPLGLLHALRAEGFTADHIITLTRAGAVASSRLDVPRPLPRAQGPLTGNQGKIVSLQLQEHTHLLLQWQLSPRRPRYASSGTRASM